MTQLVHKHDRLSGLGRRAVVHYLMMFKPGITLAVALSGAAGFILAGVRTGSWTTMQLLCATAGLCMACTGSGLCNQLWEHELDRMMPRTMDRIIPARQLGKISMLTVGLLFLAGGMTLMLVCRQYLAVWLTLAAAMIYLLVYTPLKQVTYYSMFIGTVPGALPPVIGYAAGSHSLGIEAWLLFFILVLWQIPHFLAISWQYRLDYQRAGLRVLSTVDTTGRQTSIFILLCCSILIPMSIVPALTKNVGLIYLVTAPILGLVYLGGGIMFAGSKSDRSARMLFWISIIYLPLLLITLMLNASGR